MSEYKMFPSRSALHMPKYCVLFFKIGRQYGCQYPLYMQKQLICGFTALQSMEMQLKWTSSLVFTILSHRCAGKSTLESCVWFSYFSFMLRRHLHASDSDSIYVDCLSILPITLLQSALNISVYLYLKHLMTCLFSNSNRNFQWTKKLHT